VSQLLLAIAKSAEALGVSETTFRAKFLPHLPVVSIGARRLVVVKELNALLRRRELTALFGGRERLVALVSMLRGGGHAYLVRATNGLVKIGCSVDPQSRFHNLLTMSPLPLDLVATCPGGYSAESYLHGIFRELRSHGEWFREVPEMLRELRGIETDLSVRRDLLLEAARLLDEQEAAA
jgi:hypothetical protein